MKAQIVPATRAHAESVAANIRDADRAELWTTSRGDPLAVLLRRLDSSPEPLAAI